MDTAPGTPGTLPAMDAARKPQRRGAFWGALAPALVCGWLGACASTTAPTPAPMRIDAADYAAAFQGAKDVLRDAGFVLDRVDARHGVITTIPRASAGYATPWMGHARTPGVALDDLLHNHARAVAVEFTPGPIDPPADDMRTVTGPIEVRVIAEILRAERRGRQLDATQPRRSTYTIDLVALRSDESPASIRVIRRDPHFEVWLCERLADRVQLPSE